MNIALFVAKRYLFSKKSRSAINIISWISVFSIAIATFALVVVLSAFNGLQFVVESMYEGFEPHVKVSPAKGKYMTLNDEQIKEISNIDGILHVNPIVEELTLVRYGDKQSPCTIKGVEKSFIKSNRLDSSLINGSSDLEMNGIPMALIGYGMSSSLAVYLNNAMDNLKIYAPRIQKGISLDPSSAFYSKSITPGGIYLINPDIDNKYLIVPIDFARELLHISDEMTDLELKTVKGEEENVKAMVQNILGADFSVQSRFDLNPIIYKTNKSEKMVTFFILSFILIISTFNVISTLTMILLEKRKDIVTMNYLGFGKSTVRNIFVNEGMLINGLGAGIGLISGIILCLLQQYVGLVRLEGGIIEYYPVQLLFSDLVLILSTVLIVGLTASYFPSRILIKGGYQEATLREV